MKFINLLLAFLALLFGASFAPAVLGHHSDAGYDRDTVVAFEGVVTRYVFRNPHVQIIVETENENGDTVEWDMSPARPQS